MSQQEEERDVLDSIYGEDERFKEISPTVYQYKYGEDGSKLSFLLEIVWTDCYPSSCPTFNLNSFYNNHLSPTKKAAVLKEIMDESATIAGEVQTYTMIEWTRENYDRLVAQYVVDIKDDLTDESAGNSPTKDTDKRLEEGGATEEGKTKLKKEQLTKAQKRREWDKKEGKGEVPRGHDWVDVCKHLLQTGYHESDGQDK